MSQKSKYDEKMKSSKVYIGEMWDIDEVEEEFHKYYRKNKKKIRDKQLRKKRNDPYM